MNKNDIKILKLNYESFRKRLADSRYKEDFDISSGCFVSFGTVGATIFKYKKNRLYRKIVNGWKELSFNEFMEKFNIAEWEKV